MVHFAVAAALAALLAAPAPRPTAPKADRLVGVFYFPGWEAPESWWPVLAHPEVQHPLVGPYNQASPEVADLHIQWALDHGVSFFAYDYYTHHGSEMLEDALEQGILKSRNIPQFKFCLNWCNHAPWQTMTAEQLREFGEVVVPKYLTHPSYLRLDGKPVLMILSAASFVKCLGIEGARKAFEELDARCRKEGLPGVRIVSCEGEIVNEQILKDTLAAGVSSFAIYNYPYAGTPFTGPGKEGQAPYEALEKQGEGLWKHWSGLTGGRFWPTVMTGWDRRAWCRDEDLLRTGSTPDLFERQIRKARENTNAYGVVMIEAWNEWGEGSVLEPSDKWGFGYLDRVRKVFCPNAPAHKDAAPRLRSEGALHSARLPSIRRWGFDRDASGWKPRACAGFAAEWGSLVFTTETGDPQVSSPWTFVPCAQVKALRVRMRLTAPSPAPLRCELFWDTERHGMSGRNSAGIDVQPDGQWHSYTIPLAGNPAWTGMLERMRLDPVNAAGVKVEIDTIELI